MVVTIRDGLQFLQSSFDYADLDGCFDGSNSGWSDLDGWSERNGALLFLERKLNDPRGTLKTAAIIGHKAMVAQHKNNMVITFWAQGGGLGITCRCGEKLLESKPLEVVEMAVRDNYGNNGTKQPAALEDVRAACNLWWRRANNSESGAA